MLRADAIRREDDAFTLASPRACVASGIVRCCTYIHVHEALSTVGVILYLYIRVDVFIETKNMAIACTMYVSMIGGTDGAFCHACIRPCFCVLSLGGVSIA